MSEVNIYWRLDGKVGYLEGQIPQVNEYSSNGLVKSFKWVIVHDVLN